MGSLLRQQKVRNTLWQVLYVSIVAILLISAVLTAKGNLDAQGITSGFSFLFKSTGWDVNFSVLRVTASDPYWWFFVNGMINTLVLGVVGLVLATLVGAIIGIARTSSNELARLLGRSYVDVFRNIPIILQLFFWYAVITHLPTPRNAHEAWGVLLSNRGLYIPTLNVAWPALTVSLLAVLLAVALPIWLGRTTKLTRLAAERRGLRLAAAAAALLCACVVLLLGRVSGAPVFDVPALQGLNIRGGFRIAPEFAALSIAIAIYGGSYIGEIVRGGFNSVGKGQIEAAQSLGLSSWHIFSLVRFPLALRAMLPILANQYVWLIKATTLGIAIGFTDFFMITALTINHSGQTIEAIGILMAGFLVINLSIAAIFNRINKLIALKGNQLRG